MTHEWMIDVLADLRQYAIRHYYLRLAEQLDDAIVAAAVELRQAETVDAGAGAPGIHDGPAEVASLVEARRRPA